MLRKLDPARAKTIERQNPVRLIRAIEIAKAIGKVPKLSKKSDYDVRWIGINPSEEVLKRRIRARLLARLKRTLFPANARARP
jgi:tRNA dimethylallyltransferase